MDSRAGLSLQEMQIPVDERGLRHDLGQAISAMFALLGVIEADPLHAAWVIPRLDQLRLQTEWMRDILADGSGHPEQTDVGDGVAQAWAAASQHAQCTVRLVREPAPQADVDPWALRRAVRNLLDNAIRAAGRDGTVEVAVRHAPRGIDIEVSDDGPGFGLIPHQQGLGLAAARRFATQSGGQLTIGASALGGTVVRIQLPSSVDGHQGIAGDPA